MIIDLKTISHDSPKHFEFCLEKGWWGAGDQDDQITGISVPITARIDIYRTGDKYALEGDMSGAVRVVCDRCLNHFDHEIKTGFKLFFARSHPHANKGEIELLEDDMETGFINGEGIELDDIFREQLYLSLPIKCLCRDDCQGLCPVCGADLNVQGCHCKR